MFMIDKNMIENNCADLQILLDEFGGISECLEFCMRILVDIDGCVDDNDKCEEHIGELYIVLGGLARYMESLKPVIDRYYWYEYRIEKAKEDAAKKTHECPPTA